MSFNKPKAIVCLNDGTVYQSISNCSKVLGISAQNIRKVLQGKRKSCKGYEFKFVED